MTDPGITLNIYNKPPQIGENQIDNDNNNQNETNLNLKNDLPNKSSIDPTPAPSPNYLQSIDNTRNESMDTIENNQSSVPPVPVQYQGPQTPIYGQPRPMQPIMVMPNPQPVQPVLQPIYRDQNNPYQQGQVIIMQENPNALEINKAKAQHIWYDGSKKSDDTKKCCGFLAGCLTFLATCCLISWCIGGSGRRGRW